VQFERRTEASASARLLRLDIDEPDEQRRVIFGGAWGEKGAGQGEHRSIQHSPDTVRGTSVPDIERCASRSIARQIHRGGSRMRESRSYGSGAAKLAAIPMGESPIDRRGPAAVVVISSSEEGDRIMESLGVKAPVAGRDPGQIRQRG
jgi:hypothetical protein